MEPEAVLNLFDSFWFHRKIFEKQPTTSTSSTPEPNPVEKTEENPPSEPRFSAQSSSIITRSKSDQLFLIKPYLQTTLAEREISPEIPKPPQLKKPRKIHNRRKKRLSKSLSELEFEEVKGFMDLGFVFSEEDKDSSLVEIIPGLQRLGQKTDFDFDFDERSVEESSEQRVRPYLSEAWEESEFRQKEENSLMEWTAPAFSNEIDMKDSLRWWAHTVAYSVR